MSNIENLTARMQQEIDRQIESGEYSSDGMKDIIVDKLGDMVDCPEEIDAVMEQLDF